MKPFKIFLFCCIFFLCLQSHLFALLTTNIVVGDIDGFVYEGGSDLIAVEPDWLTWAESYSSHLSGWPRAPFDWVIPAGTNHPEGIAYANQWLAFSFYFNLDTRWEILSASIAFAFRAADQTSEGDFIIIESEANKHSFEDLGWLPITQSGTDIRSIGLSPNLISLLGKDSLNIYIADDTAIDYAVLTITQIPEPCAILILGLGGLLIRKR